MSGEQEMSWGGDQRSAEFTVDEPGKVSFSESDLLTAMAAQLGLDQSRGEVQTKDPLIKKFNQAVTPKDILEEMNTSDGAGKRGPDAMNTPTTDGEPEVEQTKEEPITNDDGRQFSNKEEYLTWKVGEDGRRWGEEKAALNERIAKLEGMAQAGMQGQQNQNPADIKRALKEQLFQGASKEEMESGFVGVDAMVDAFVQNGALLGNNIQQYLQPFMEKVEGLESRLSEISARSKYNIDPTKEKAVLQKHPHLAKLSHEERMAVLADLAPKSESPGVQPPAQQRQRIPKPNAQEYVEGSVQSEPRSTGFEEFESEFGNMSTKKQLNLLSGIIKGSSEAQTLFQQPDTF